MKEHDFRKDRRAYHVQYGPVSLKHDDGFFFSVPESKVWQMIGFDGRARESDAGRVLFTLDEATKYGWLKPEPRVVEFVSVVVQEDSYVDAYSVGVDIDHPQYRDLRALKGKEVTVVVTEIVS